MSWQDKNMAAHVWGLRLVLEPWFLESGTGFEKSCNQRLRTFRMNIDFEVSSCRPHWLWRNGKCLCFILAAFFWNLATRQCCDALLLEAPLPHSKVPVGHANLQKLNALEPETATHVILPCWVYWIYRAIWKCERATGTCLKSGLTWPWSPLSSSKQRYLVGVQTVANLKPSREYTLL